MTRTTRLNDSPTPTLIGTDEFTALGPEVQSLLAKCVPKLDIALTDIHRACWNRLTRRVPAATNSVEEARVSLAKVDLETARKGLDSLSYGVASAQYPTNDELVYHLESLREVSLDPMIGPMRPLLNDEQLSHLLITSWAKAVNPLVDGLIELLGSDPDPELVRRLLGIDVEEDSDSDDSHSTIRGCTYQGGKKGDSQP
ncbi:hypothetical protein M231_00887 [Tremella mesenterica]|uniref:Uncharacterized protein n=1 Tax=Tremella mesenterica TaxID=5217 RepID=A0A4Q1BV10_TREME|nr:hypothetical protein M231_00887 [Tremella mesenterica]